MPTHIILNGKVVNTIIASVAEAQQAFPEATCLNAAAGGNIGDLWDGATFTAPVKVLTREEKKQQRADAVKEITVTTSTGKTFDGDEDSQNRMTRAIIGMQAASRETITWTLTDNTITPVTVAELTEALCLSGEEQAAIWPIE